jgi:hypothetical protein
MKRTIAVALLIVGLTSHGETQHEPGKHVVLPNPKLLRCMSSDCAQLWQDRPPDANDIYSKQLIVDLYNTPCPLGVMARYDNSVSMDDLKAAINERYGQWALADFSTGSLMMWRVEPEKFAIQLSATDKRMAKLAKLAGDKEEVETKLVIYVAFQPPKKCSLR